MNAPMFGMIIPERNDPNRWTATLPLPGAVAVIGADVVVIACSLLVWMGVVNVCCRR